MGVEGHVGGVGGAGSGGVSDVEDGGGGVLMFICLSLDGKESQNYLIDKISKRMFC